MSPKVSPSSFFRLPNKGNAEDQAGVLLTITFQAFAVTVPDPTKKFGVQGFAEAPAHRAAIPCLARLICASQGMLSSWGLAHSSRRIAL